MQAIAEEGHGLVIYEHQEGRGIGLMAKLQAYELQDVGIDTVEANHVLGFKADCRDCSLPAAILRHLGVRRVRILPADQERKTGPRAEPTTAQRSRHRRPTLAVKGKNHGGSSSHQIETCI
jgi:GTP cyclohydrolase II